jgi:bacterioferritin-associated ferredoxin
MIVCSCNVISDKQMFSLVAAAQQRPPAVRQVYAGLGYQVRCGRCAPTIKTLRDEASAAKIDAGNRDNFKGRPHLSS